MLDWFFATLRSSPEIAIFLSLALGYYFGKFTFFSTAFRRDSVIVGCINIRGPKTIKTIFA